MVAHNAQGIELEAILVFALLERKQQQLTAFISDESKFTIVAASGDVVAISVRRA